MNKLLEGTSLMDKINNAKERKSLIGTPVKYLQEADIDRSGRGYFFTRFGRIAGFCRREVAMDVPENYIVHLSNLKEMVIWEERLASDKENEGTLEEALEVAETKA